jgi:hypothetical protein
MFYYCHFCINFAKYKCSCGNYLCSHCVIMGPNPHEGICPNCQNIKTKNTALWFKIHPELLDKKIDKTK